MGLVCHLSWCRTTHMAGSHTASRPWACTHRTSLYLQVSSLCLLSSLLVPVWHTGLTTETTKYNLGLWFTACIFSTGGPGLEPPYRPIRNPQMNKMMPTRPSYPGMMPNMQGSMPGVMGMDKQYPMGYKPQSTMAQGQILRQHLQVRLVSQSAMTGHTAPYGQLALNKSSS